MSNSVPVMASKSEVEVDLEGYQLRAGPKRLPLTRTEREVLKVMLGSLGQAVGRQVILDQVWGFGRDVGFSNVDNVIARLRAKLRALEARTPRIATIRGVGYRWTV